MRGDMCHGIDKSQADVCAHYCDRHSDVLQVLKYLLANGSMEYKSAREEKGILHGDEKELEEPLLANLLHGKVRHTLTPCTLGNQQSPTFREERKGSFQG